MDKSNQQDAIATLERCAALILDDSLPFEFNHEALSRLFEAAFGESHESFEADTVIPVNPNADGGESAHSVSLLRGVILNLDGEMRLMSVSVTPRKARERERLMGIVGIASDPMGDVAVRHDDYLDEIYDEKIAEWRCNAVAGRPARSPAILQPGVVPYSDALKLQRRVHGDVADGRRRDALIVLEHPPVYTLGRRARAGDVLADARELAAMGVETHPTDRGGEVTYHGPGQLVAYPIVNLRRWGGGPLKYVRALESVIIAALAEFGIDAESVGRPTGVWVGERKIAAIGVKVSRRVTMHGFALNVSTDLSHFDRIVACGLPDARATSMKRELGRDVSVSEVAPVLIDGLRGEFGLGA